MLFIKKILVFSCFLLCYTSLYAQKFEVRGKVENKNGEAVHYANLYIAKFNKGVSSNSDGFFKITLDKGEYVLTISAMGYKTQKQQLDVKDNMTLDIKLEGLSYQLSEVKVTPSKFDSAQYVMRKAIAKAPQYAYSVKRYEADLFESTEVDIHHLPKLLAKKLLKEANIKEGDLEFTESLSHITYTVPNNFKREIKAINYVLPRELEKSGNFNIVVEDLYRTNDKILGSILTPSTFDKYRYRYKDSYWLNDKKIHVIEFNSILPKGPKGEITILDNCWSISQFSMKIDQKEFSYEIEQSYYKPKENIVLLSSARLTNTINIFGIHFDIHTSVSYSYSLVDEVKENDVLVADKTSRSDSVYLSPKELIKLDKWNRKMGAILEKEKLSVRDLFRMKKLAQKSTIIENNLDASEINTSYFDRHQNYEVLPFDSASVVKDETFWKKYRITPLTPLQKDRLKQQKKFYATKNRQVNKETAMSLKLLGSLFLGQDYNIDSTNNRSLSSVGLIYSLMDPFNPVDGAKPGVLIDYDNQAKGLKTALDFEYGFSSERLSCNWKGEQTYSKKHSASWGCNVGTKTEDFKKDMSMPSFIDACSSLLMKKNYKRYYLSNYLNLWHLMDISKGLSIRTAIGYEQRKQLYNNTNYSFGKKDVMYHSNVPENKTVTPSMLEDSNSSYFDLSLTYQWANNPKMPLISLSYHQAVAISDWNTQSRNAHLYGNIRQKIRTLNANYKLQFSGGKIWNASHFSEYQHFIGSEVPFNFSFKSLLNDVEVPTWEYFSLRQDYSTSESDWFLNATYTAEYHRLFLKQLPILRGLEYDEIITVNYLKNSFESSYVEFGYGLGNLLGLDVSRLMFNVGYQKYREPIYGVKLLIL
ncbi:DUF5686 and carboxypeptidase regulatory-like domain-containing protein [Halosquirtibacter xylanolyticus]|uniref:DUF5686 and carboxypeptidase-like regulatory domain-containing protein n=1 Tax=Halosquirtibacter xylanolyticus TaxID=3374599 RepID=UPI00374850B4|nr:DUF5686 and carboxypeptidase regulatory-like domain-containing protein [Prolixibacteraceae bacterium]